MIERALLPWQLELCSASAITSLEKNKPHIHAQLPHSSKKIEVNWTLPLPSIDKMAQQGLF